MAKQKRIRDLNANMKARYRLDREEKVYIQKHSYLNLPIVAVMHKTKHPKEAVMPFVKVIHNYPKWEANDDGTVSNFVGVNLHKEIEEVGKQFKENNLACRYVYISKPEENIVKSFDDFKAFKAFLTPDRIISKKNEELIP